MAYVVHTTSTTPLVLGEHAEGESRVYTESGRLRFVATWSGVYMGTKVSEHEEAEGEVIHLFRDGHINHIPQARHGFPVSQYQGVAPAAR